MACFPRNYYSFNGNMTLTLYHNTFCPYAQRARLAVVETNLNVEEIEIDLSNKPEWYYSEINDTYIN
ncbi:hypothetical protein BDF22DRAFT_666572 [Syncephalis plumigaleata]|nr:hypothetical protein BDF22DRAFT_666572 [Syncephalis plumigaleata]